MRDTTTNKSLMPHSFIPTFAKNKDSSAHLIAYIDVESSGNFYALFACFIVIYI